MQSPNDVPLTSMSAGSLAAAIRARQVSVTEVVAAHIDRIEAQRALNAVIWPLFDEAMEQARAADERLARGAPPGLLFGVPMTIKDQFMVRGTPTSCGLAHRAGTVIDDEGPLVARLREHGAIFLGKTNLPQLLVSHSCDHALYGPARNPWDLERTPGGSSGGEAAIIAAGGSPLGLGCDMGGSIRVPAHYTGIVGLKPTEGRFPNDDTPFDAGYFSSLFGFEGFVPQAGPMARTVDDLELLMDVLLTVPLGGGLGAPPVPWTGGTIAPVDGLRIGTFTDNGFFDASPALRRLTREAGEALSAMGLEVRAFEPPEPCLGLWLGYRLLGADGGAWIEEALAGEKPIDDIRGLMDVAGVPNALRRPLAAALELMGQGHAARSMRTFRRCTCQEYWDLTADRSRYRSRFVRAMRDQGVDVLVCPPHGLPAPPIGGSGSGVGSLAASHSTLFNVLGMPAGVVAAGRVGHDEESDRPPSRDRVEREASLIERGSAGMPMGVQVVGCHWREDQVLAVMKALETHFGPSGYLAPPEVGGTGSTKG